MSHKSGVAVATLRPAWHFEWFRHYPIGGINCNPWGESERGPRAGHCFQRPAKGWGSATALCPLGFQTQLESRDQVYRVQDSSVQDSSVSALQVPDSVLVQWVVSSCLA